MVVDPRFAARRQAVRDARRRRRRQGLAGVASVVGLLAGLWGLTRSPLLDVDRVQVKGGSITGIEGVRTALGVGTGDQMLDVDTGLARARLEALPWIRSARVVRTWPGTLRVVVVERRPVARIAGPDGRWWLADATGRLLDGVAEAPPALVEVSGTVDGAQPGAQLGPAASAALSIVPLFPPTVARDVVGLRLAPDRQVELVIWASDPEPGDGSRTTVVADPGPFADPARTGVDSWASGLACIAADGDWGQVTARDPALDVPAPYAVVRLGTLDQVEVKLLALETLLTQVDRTDLARIDVRVAAKAAVTRRAGCR